MKRKFKFLLLVLFTIFITSCSSSSSSSSKSINNYKVAFVVNYGGGTVNLSTGYEVGNYVENVKLNGKSINFSFKSSNNPVEIDVPAGEHTLTWTIKRINGSTINYTESSDTINVSKNCIYDILEYKVIME